MDVESLKSSVDRFCQDHRVEGGRLQRRLTPEVESPTDAAYEAIAYKVVMDVMGATEEQIDRLRQAC